MQLEDFFDFDPGVANPSEIRIKGHRILIEHVLDEYLLRDMTLEELVARFDTLTKEQILAVLLYYHHNKEAMDRYMTDWWEWCRRFREENLRQHADWHEKLRQLKAQLQSAPSKQASS